MLSLGRIRNPYSLRLAASLTQVSLLTVALSSCGGGGGGGNGNPAQYRVGGTVSGLASGATVALQNTGGNDTTLSTDGSFRFSSSLPSGAAYAVTILTQPTGQTCTVASGGGSVGSADVTGVQITCATNLYKISGTLSGLTASSSVTLLDNAGDPTLDGSQPQAALIQGSDGNFYGTSYVGGLQDDGTVFKITPGGLETVLYSFTGGTDGSQPLAALTQGTDGNLYGTTPLGGTSGQGTVRYDHERRLE